MSDCLNKDVKVSSAVYCEDPETGEPDPETAMFSWMAVRAAGPNVLKDTTLCGTTIIKNPTVPNQAFFQCYLLKPGNNIEFLATQSAEWIPVGFAAYINRLWTIKYQGSETNQLYNIFDYASGQGIQLGSINITNVSGRDITARLTLTISVEILESTGTSFIQTGIWQSEVDGSPTPSVTQQTFIKRVENDTYETTVDYICIMKAGDIAQPIVRFIDGAVGKFSVANCNLVAEFIEYYNNNGGDDVLPGGEIPPPPPPT